LGHVIKLTNPPDDDYTESILSEAQQSFKDMTDKGKGSRKRTREDGNNGQDKGSNKGSDKADDKDKRNRDKKKAPEPRKGEEPRGSPSSK
jgi:hypothetical protein